MKRLFLVIAMSAMATICAAAPAVVTLWPEGVPGPKAIGAERLAAGKISNVSEPTLTVYGPAVDKANGAAVIICPGGGYTSLSTEREGVQYANWLGTLGVTSFVLKYRMAEFGRLGPPWILNFLQLSPSLSFKMKMSAEKPGTGLSRKAKTCRSCLKICPMF